MCTNGDGAPGSAGEALAVIGTALDFLNGPAGDAVDAAGLGGVLEALAGIDARHAAVRMRFLTRFDANDCHDSDGYQSTASWLAGKTKTTLRQARGEMKQARRMTQAHPALGEAMAAGWLSQAWAASIAGWTGKLPEEARGKADEILLEAAAGGADLDDLKLLAITIEEAWRRENGPDDDGDDDGFDDRFVQLDTTMDGAGRVTGNLTPECAAALQAVLESLGKKRGKEDTRTSAQRFHDALQEGCELLIGAKMVPDRAGADTHVDVHIGLGQLMDLPGAGALEEAWLRAKAGEHGYLAGGDAQAIACDALIVPVVTGAPDWNVIGQMISLVWDAFAHGTPGRDGTGQDDGSDGAGRDGEAAARPPVLSPDVWEALQYALAKLAIGFVSGPGALASVLRTGLLPDPFNTVSVPIDVGYSDHIPEAIRRAVILRDRRCAWPGGCDSRPAKSDVHHTKHKKDGGPTSVSMCGLFCQFHHDICVHRWGWKVELLPDGSVKATSPDGEVLRSHPPPPGQHA